MTTIEIGGHSYSGATGGAELGGGKELPAEVTVLIPGAAMDRTVWSLQTRWLAHRGIASLAIDLPGHGGSTEPRRESVAGYADWIGELVERIDRPTHLVGHSMGSFVALEAAASVTGVASLMMIGTAAAMPVHPALLDAAEANDPLAAQLMSGWAFASHTRTGPHPSPGASMVGATQAMIGQAAPGVLHSDLALCAAYENASTTAAEVRVPTTLLLGQLDKMTPVRTAAPLIDAFENPTVEIVPAVGHMIQIEAPRVTRIAIERSASTV